MFTFFKDQKLFTVQLNFSIHETCVRSNKINNEFMFHLVIKGKNKLLTCTAIHVISCT